MPPELCIGLPETALADSIAGGPLRAADALRCAAALAAEIRRLHDAGDIAGDLTPERIHFCGARAVLLPGGAETEAGPWSAPERVTQAPDARTDIYSFGAILYHMLAGHAPAGASLPALARDLAAVEHRAVAESNGDAPATARLCAGLCRLVLQCLAPEPEHRFQRMQAVGMELRLVALTAKQADPNVAGRRERAEAALRAEVTALRDAILPRLEALEARAAGFDRAAAEIREDAAGAAADRAMLRSGAALHASAITSLQTAASQTDDMVERLVEALDTLQTLLLERTDPRPPGNG